MENNIKNILKIGLGDDFNDFDNFKINEIYDVRDRSNNRFIYNEVLYKGEKIFIETNFGRVKNIDLVHKKTIIEFDSESLNFFDNLDNRCVNLLGDLFENNDEFINMIGDFDKNLEYNSLIKENSKNIKFKFDIDSNIMHNDQKINFTDLKIDDMVRTLISVESINLYTDEGIAFLRLYVHVCDVYRPKVYNFQKKCNIINYKFSSEIDEKIKLEEEDISYVKNENKLENEDENKLEEIYNSNKNENIIVESIIKPEPKKRGRKKK